MGGAVGALVQFCGRSTGGARERERERERGSEEANGEPSERESERGANASERPVSRNQARLRTQQSLVASFPLSMPSSGSQDHRIRFSALRCF
jgi:hypothetical protein